MPGISDEIHEWQMELAVACYRILVPEDTEEPLVDADEVCFMGAFGPLPPGVRAMSDLGVGYVDPEVYFFAVSDGEPIPPNIWFTRLSESHHEKADQTLRKKMRELWNIHAKYGRRCPAVTMTAVVMATGEAITVYEFDTPQPPPGGGMTAADLAFDRWMARVVRRGSAFRELND
jgi:hypothetical protein